MGKEGANLPKAVSAGGGETKIKALDCFKIQIEANYDNDLEKWHSFILAPNRYWGLESGVMYAEPYGQLEIHEVHNQAKELLVP